MSLAKTEIKKCCAEMESMLNDFKEVGSLPIGTGEISGDVYVDEQGISISDGWSFIPYIPFYHCPYCGAKRYERTVSE